MDISFSGVLTVIDGNNSTDFSLPDEGIPIGIANLSESDLKRTIKVAAGAVDVAVSLGGVDEGKLLIIITDNDISFKKNSAGGEANIIKSNQRLSTESKRGIYLHTTSGVTSLYFSNSGGSEAVIKLYVMS